MSVATSRHTRKIELSNESKSRSTLNKIYLSIYSVYVSEGGVVGGGGEGVDVPVKEAVQKFVCVCVCHHC